MHDRDDLDLRVALEETFHLGCIDRIVVRHLELVDVGAEIAEPVAHALAEDAGDEVQHRRPGADQRSCGRLEAQHGLALHQHDVRSRLQDLRNLPLRATEAVEKRRVVVVRDRRAERGERSRRGGHRSCTQCEVGIVHRSPFRPILPSRSATTWRSSLTPEICGAAAACASHPAPCSPSRCSRHVAISATRRRATSSTIPRPSLAALPASASSVWTSTRDPSPFGVTFIVIAASSEPCAPVSFAFARRTALLLGSSCSEIQSEPLYPRRIGPSRTVTFAGYVPSAAAGPSSPPGTHGATCSRSRRKRYASSAGSRIVNVVEISIYRAPRTYGRASAGGR